MPGSWGGVCSGGSALGGSAPGGMPGGDTPPKTATSAGGTHPTGMHSCSHQAKAGAKAKKMKEQTTKNRRIFPLSLLIVNQELNVCADASRFRDRTV